MSTHLHNSPLMPSNFSMQHHVTQVLNKSFAIGWDFLPNDNIPIIFHPIFNFTQRNGSNLSNNVEAKIIRFYVRKLLLEGINGVRIKEEDIGIVTAHHSQIKRIEKELFGYQSVEISLPEFYAGRMKKVIIVSTVVSGVGFPFGIQENEKVT